MKQLYIMQNKDGSFRLEADLSGEETYEALIIKNKMTKEEAKSLVLNGVADLRI